MTILELFAGSRSIGKVAEKYGFEVFSVDINKFDKIDLVIDILDLKKDMIPFIRIFFSYADISLNVFYSKSNDCSQLPFQFSRAGK